LKFLGWVLALAVAAVALALAGKGNTGFALIVAPPYRYELTLNFLLLLFVAGWILLNVLTRIVLRGLALPGEVREYRARRRRERAHAAIDSALLALLEGRYGKARQHAERALALGEGPLAALLAARAAIEVRDFDTANELLLRIAAMTPQYTAARLMMDAEIELARQRPQTALTLLQKLRADAGMHTAALRLELRALQAARRWGDVPALVEQLKRREVLDKVQADQLRWHAQAEHLASLAGDSAGLNEYWQRLPENDRRHHRVADAAAQARLASGERAQAAETIAASLESDWDSKLVQRFGDCQGEDNVALIQRAESWLAGHHDDATLLLVLGRLCLAEKLWGKAQTYLEASVALQEGYAAHLALAELHAGLGRNDEANAHLAAAMRLALDQLRATPAAQEA